jgi:hypothetical protein
MRRLGIAVLTAICALVLSVPAEAETIGFFEGSGTYTDSGDTVTLNASALFEVNGDILTITFSNTGDTSGSLTDKPSTTLSGLFFDLPDGITLTPTSATSPNAIVQANLCDIGPCTGTNVDVGGEFAYATGTFGSHLGDSGISGNGYIGTSTGNFGGSDLDTPPSPDGMNFGIVAPTSTNQFMPNGGLESEPLIDGTVVFTLTINGGSLTLGDISNVSFQYGTSLDQPSYPGGNSGLKIPEPATFLLLAPAIVAGALRRRARAKGSNQAR